MNPKEHYKHLYNKVNQLTFSDMSIFELMSFANEACALAYQKDAEGHYHACLSKLKKIKESQIRPLLEEELVFAERQQLFTESKNDLAQTLKLCFAK